LASKTRRPPLSSAELCAYLNVTPRWVRHNIDNKRVPYYKVGRLLRFDPDEIDAWLAENHVPIGGKKQRRRQAS
jgi:excisionase family DNA binding protein